MNATSYTLALSVLKTMHPEPAEHRLSPRGTLRDKALFKVEQSESLTVDHGGKSLYGCGQCTLFGGGGGPRRRRRKMRFWSIREGISRRGRAIWEGRVRVAAQTI